MNIILLSGGSGKRLWPLSNEVRSKQFIRLLPSPKGDAESMIQRVVRQINESKISESITIATGVAQIDQIRGQLGPEIDVVTEPTRRDTFPAIALACIYLRDKGLSLDEVVVVMPSDVFTEKGYFETIGKMSNAVHRGLAELVLMGINPTCASNKYGYILPQITHSKNGAYQVCRFFEKPESAVAKKLIKKNAFWNGGVFAFKLGYIIGLIEKYMIDVSYQKLRANFNKLPKISFDYAVVEKAKSIAVIPFNGFWKDLGTWDTLSEYLATNSIGNVVNASNGRNTHVINELELPIVCVGVENLIVSASPDGILVADKNRSTDIKDYISLINSRPMFEERRWGYYKILRQTEYLDGHKSLTKLLHINISRSISYHSHAMYDEILTVIDGKVIVVIDGIVTTFERGNVVKIKAGQKHAIKAITTVEIIEVQSGTQILEEDIKKYDWQWE